MPIQLAKHLQEDIEKNLKTSLLSTQVVGGGSINKAQQLKTSDGLFFIKYNNIPTALDMFEQEAKGLELLRASDTCKIPEVLALNQIEDTAYLVLEYIETSPNKKSSEQLGIALAGLHRQTALQFGLDHDNYIGRLAQSHTYWASWVVI